MIKQYKLRFYNFRLIILAAVTLSTIGVLLVGSARNPCSSKQLMGVILGLIAMVIVSLMDFSWILNSSWILYDFQYSDAVGSADLLVIHSRWSDAVVEFRFHSVSAHGAVKDHTDFVFCKIFYGP